jgi:BirA family biotin operon repressor/biotin-[acetyl-CoA-carboxylase] ligase
VSDLDAGAIAAALDRLGATLGAPVTVLGETVSTNDDARAAAAAGAPHGAAFVADAQTKGRGRGGHSWHSPPGENLYMSMILRPRVPAASVASITLAVGVAVARVVEAIVGERAPVFVKWPNDVLAGARAAHGLPRKLAGVLVEGQLRGSEVTGLVAGVGLNVHARAFPEEIADRAVSLAMLGDGPLDRSAIAASVLAAIANASARFEEDRLASFAADLARLDALRGARVEVSGVRGVASGIDAEGRLLVRADHGALTPVVSGEVALL